MDDIAARPTIRIWLSIASLDKGDYLQDVLAGGFLAREDQYVLTFDKLTKDKRFVKLMRTALRRLEQVYCHAG